MVKDLVTRIEEARARSKLSDMYIVAFSLLMLKSKLQEIPTTKSEALGYFPVAVVAHLEVFFKHALRDLLDAGEPFLTRTDALIKDGRIRLDSSVAVALAGQRVTFGELISASLGYSDLRRACGYFSQLLAADFLSLIRQRIDDAGSEDRFDAAMASLASLYDSRHIIAHEVRPNLDLSHEVIEEWIEAAFTLVEPAADIVGSAIFPDGLPETQSEMNRRASEDAHAALERVSETYGFLAALHPGLKDRIEASHSRWLDWGRDAAILCRELLVDEHSMGPTIGAAELQSIAEAELDRIRSVLQRATAA